MNSFLVILGFLESIKRIKWNFILGNKIPLFETVTSVPIKMVRQKINWKTFFYYNAVLFFDCFLYSLRIVTDNIIVHLAELNHCVFELKVVHNLKNHRIQRTNPNLATNVVKIYSILIVFPLKIVITIEF